MKESDEHNLKGVDVLERRKLWRTYQRPIQFSYTVPQLVGGMCWRTKICARVIHVLKLFTVHFLGSKRLYIFFNLVIHRAGKDF